MSKGDNEPLLGLATAMVVGKINKAMLKEDTVEKGIVDVDEVNVGYRVR